MSHDRPNWMFRIIAWASRYLVAPVERVGPAKARRALRSAMRGPRAVVGRRPPLAAVIDGDVAGVPVRRYRPAQAGAGTIVFFHGGGWVVGDLETHDRLAASLAAESGHEVVAVDYRLAPEHPYPAALDDCLAVTQALLTSGPVAVVGDSAGGNLAAAVAQRANVVAQVLFYPVMDCAHERPSYARYAQGYLLTAETMRYFRQAYVPDVARRHEPGASPIEAPSLGHCPPAWISLAPCDVLHDEGVAYAERLQAAGVDVTLEEVPGTLHGFASLVGLREGREAVARASVWLGDRLREHAVP